MFSLAENSLRVFFFHNQLFMYNRHSVWCFSEPLRSLNQRRMWRREWTISLTALPTVSLCILPVVFLRRTNSFLRHKLPFRYVLDQELGTIIVLILATRWTIASNTYFINKGALRGMLFCSWKNIVIFLNKYLLNGLLGFVFLAQLVWWYKNNQVFVRGIKSNSFGLLYEGP